MADKMLSDKDLTALFEAAAKDDRLAPSPHLLARVLADGEALQPKPAALAPTEAPDREGLMHLLLRALGGWPSLGGLAAATVAGVWIGFSSTTTLLPSTVAGLVDGSSSEYLAYLDTSYSFAEEDLQ